ncbi:YMGG-like glycine zipper-containing protein [Segetibacter aerophilus]|nr:YMGG-like glycine zipper-containing protein [Segetibacter aerophilus]
MKKTILSIAIAAIFASCSDKAGETTTTKTVSSTDTIGLSDYKEWKQKQEVASQQTYTSPGVEEMPAEAEPTPALEVEKPKTVIIYRDAPAKPRVAKASRPASRPVYKAPEESENAEVAKTPKPVSTGTKREPYGRGTGTTGTEGTAGSGTASSDEGSGDVAGTSSTPAEVPAKKEGGWSKAAKGGAIGGASGAVIGAVISKNKTKGAVIGGIVGAAGGYIFGKKQDKKVEKQ